MNIKNVLSSKTSSILNKTVKNPNCRLLNLFSHEIIPLHGLSTNDSWWQGNESDEYVCSNLVPIRFKRNILNDGNLPPDLVEDLIINKCEWNKKIKEFRRFYKQCKNVDRKCIKDVSFKSNQASVPKYLLKFAKLLKRDPDKYFNENYNWWYSGGTLNTLANGIHNILFHVSNAEQQTIDLSLINECDEDVNPLLRISTDEKIYSLKSSFHRDNEILVGVRHRNTIKIHDILHENNQFIIKNTSESNSKVPFTSFDINKNNIGHYCTSDVDKIIKLWNVSLNTVYSTKVNDFSYFQKDENKIDNWSDIKYLNTDTLLFMDRKNVNVIDTRCTDQHLRLIPIKNILTNCDHFSFSCRSFLSEHTVYIGSNHSVILTDFRYPKSFIYKWTHQMKSIPYVADTINLTSQKEILCFSSQLPDEKRFLVNSLQQNDSSIHSSLVPLYSLKKSLQDARLHGKCLGSYSLIDKRLGYSVSGLSLVRIADDLFILHQNSIGDVFKQKISKNLDDVGDNWSGLDKLANSMECKIPKQLHLIVTDIISMDHVIHSKRKQYKRHKPNKSDENCGVNKESWQKSPQELQNYLDLLAPNILHAWGYTGPTESHHLIQNKIVTSEMPKERVSAWLNDIQLNATNNLTLSQDGGQNETDDFELSQINDSQTQSCNLKEKVPKGVKRKRHVIGF